MSNITTEAVPTPEPIETVMFRLKLVFVALAKMDEKLDRIEQKFDTEIARLRTLNE